MEKLYDRINWHNDTTPALNESNLNQMSKAIDDIDDRVVELGGDVLVVVPQIMTYLAQAEDLYEAMENLSKHPPYIGENGHWYVWDIPTATYVDSGIDASITVQIQDITMLNYGVTPYVTNTGTDTDPIFHLFIPRAASIDHVSKTGTLVLVDTYTITMQDGNTHTFTVTNGRGITQIEKTHTEGAVDTYTISYNDNTTSTFEVTNGQGFGDMTQAAYDSDYEVVNIGGIKPFLDSKVQVTYVQDGDMLIYSSAESRFTPYSPANNVARIPASLLQGYRNYADPKSYSVHAEGYECTAGSHKANPDIVSSSELTRLEADYVGCYYEDSLGNVALVLDQEFMSISGEISSLSLGIGASFRGESKYHVYREDLITDTWMPIHEMTIEYNGGSMMTMKFVNVTLEVKLVSKSSSNYVVAFRIEATGSAGTIPTTCNSRCLYSILGEIHDDPLPSGYYAHAEGYRASGIGDYSHAEGWDTTAKGRSSHSEGRGSYGIGDYSHAEGYHCKAMGESSHAEGYNTYARYSQSHAEGFSTYATTIAHAEGNNTTAGYNAHSEGAYTCASGNHSHTEGYCTYGTDSYAHAGGFMTTAGGRSSFGQGTCCFARGDYSQAFGCGSTANADYSMAIGYDGETTWWSGRNYYQRILFGIGYYYDREVRRKMTLKMDDSDDFNAEFSNTNNAFSVDGLGNTFTTGERYMLRGCINGRLTANQDTIVLEDGAVYELITHTRLNNSTFRGATTYTIIATWAMDPNVGTTTTAQAVPQLITDGNVGTVGVVLAKLAEPYVNNNGTTAYHSKIGIACCVNTCRVRYTLKKISGSCHDFDYDWV